MRPRMAALARVARATIRSVPDRRRLALALGVWAVAATFAKAAEAGPQTFVALDYEVAPEASGCPDVEEFRAAVARQLQYDPFRPAADRRVAVQIARKEVGFDGRIRWTDADGRWVGDRRLTSRRPDCDEIAASLAFSVAVQVQLLATLAPPEPPAPPPPPEASPPVVVPAPAPAPPPEPAPGPPARRLTYSVGLGPALALGLSPQTTGRGARLRERPPDLGLAGARARRGLAGDPAPGRRQRLLARPVRGWRRRLRSCRRVRRVSHGYVRRPPGARNRGGRAGGTIRDVLAGGCAYRRDARIRRPVLRRRAPRRPA